MTGFVLTSGVPRRALATVSAASLATGVLLAGPLATVSRAAPPATFVVNTAGNASDLAINGSCDTAATAGLQCTLRAAIQEANANSGPDTIQFALASPYRVTLTATGLPQITSPVTIDGTSQPGYSPSTGVIVRVDGVSNTTGLQNGLDVQSGGSGTTIKGLEVVRFAGAGIRLQGDNNVVSGNYLGTSAGNLVNCATGSSCGNGYGVSIEDGSNNVVGGTTPGERNIVSNNYAGVWLTTNFGAPSTASNNTIKGNYIGTNVAGTAALPNSIGIYSYNYGGGADPTNTTIGGTAAGAGNLISGNSGEGASLQYGTWTVTGNIVGLNATGNAAVANGGTAGLYFTGATTQATVGGATAAARNLLSGNGQEGLEISGPTLPMTVRGNYFGTNSSGSAAIGNGYGGMYASYTDDLVFDANLGSGNYDDFRVDGGSNAMITNNSTGLAADGTTSLGDTGSGLSLNNTIDTTVDGNVLAAAAAYGLYANATDGLVVTNNRIGTDASGTADRGNSQGIYLGSSSEATIGKAGNGNLISGNDVYGIQAYDNNDSTIQANLIGTEVTGASALPNGATGIWLNASSRTLVGGTSAAQRNVIVASGVGCCEAGIYLSSADDNDILGNRIGVGATGNAIGNNWVGVYLDGSSDLNQVGDVTAGAGNLIANNADAGVVVAANGYGNTVRGNSIHDNGGLGIDLNQDGVTPNDAGDRDNGGNRLQNFPVLTTSASNVNGTELTGTLNSRANRQYTLDFYANATCDSSGNGEGATYLGSATTTTNGSGNATFHAVVAGVAPTASQVTATATDVLLGDTSEFSACLANQGGLPSASVANTSAAENAGNLTFTVSLSSAPVFTPVTIDYATSDGTATTPADYNATTGTVTFGVGETSKPVLVPIVNDSLDENDETLSLTLSNAVNAIIQPGQGTATGTILDDDAPPTVSIANAVAVTEPDAPNTVNQTFQVTLSAPSSLPVSVIAHTTPGTATENADYQGTAAQISFAPGQTTGTFTVVVNGDNIDEFNETYTARLTAPTNATIGTGAATATINDNDPAPTLTVGDVSMVEGNSGTTTFLFAVTLSQASEKNVHVVLSTANGTAKVTDSDYKPKSNSALNLGPGVTTKNFKVSVVGDTKVEANETFFVNVVTASTTNCTVVDGQGQGTILNDD